MQEQIIMIPLESTFQEITNFLRTVNPIQLDFDNFLNDYLKLLRYYKTPDEATIVFVEDLNQSFEIESGRNFNTKEREIFYHFFRLLLNQMKVHGLYVSGNRDLNELNTMSWEIYDWLGNFTPIFRNKDEFTLDQNISAGLYFYQDYRPGI